MPRPGTVTRLILILFLAFDLFTSGYALNIQTDQSFALSYGFGSPGALLLLQNSQGLSFTQSIGAMVFGKVTDELYMSAMVDEQSVGYLTLTYIPSDFKFGSVQTLGPDLPTFSIFGFSSPNLSIGQLLGNVVRDVFVLSVVNPTVYLGSIMYGSVKVYVDGKLIPQGEYTVDYDNGTITFSNFFTTELVTVEYQSATGGYSSYIGTLKSQEKIGGFSVKTYACTVVASPNNQYFLKAIAVPQNSDSSLSFALNFDESPSVKVEGKSIFPFDGGKVSSSFSYTSVGFRDPLGIIQTEGVGGSLGFENVYGRIAAKLDSNELLLSVDSSSQSMEFKVGKAPNLGIDYTSKNLRLGFTADSSGVRTFESLCTDDLSLRSEQNLLSKTFGVAFDLATPVTLDASIDSGEIGVALSKSFFPYTVSASMTGIFSAPYGVLNVGFTKQSLWDGSILVGGANLSISTNSTFVASGSLELNLPDSDVLSLTLNTNPGLELSFSNYNYTLDAKFDGCDTILTGSAAFEMWNLNFEGDLSVALVDSQLGGTFGVKVWRDDY